MIAEMAKAEESESVSRKDCRSGWKWERTGAVVKAALRVLKEEGGVVESEGDIFTKEISEERRCLGVVPNESAVQIGEADKSRHIPGRFGSRPRFDCFHLLRDHSNSFRRYYVTKKINLDKLELTLFCLGIKVVVTEFWRTWLT